MQRVKSFDISKRQVYEAYKAVKANRGSAGVDKITLEEFDKNLSNNLYKLWNRMASGTYFPKPVKAVEIPKKNGGVRILGIPTVEDRIAQMVVKNSFEDKVDPYFLKDSYGYRPGKSAHDAIEVTRKRCWKSNWVLEFDIKGLFDNIDHSLLMKAVKKHTESKWEILYIKRWLNGEVKNIDGKVVTREVGTPQGGVISPVLANLFLHYAFDKWMDRRFINNKWCRYADDGIIHCSSMHQAKYILKELMSRMKECKLEIHPTKTKIIYCKDSNRKGTYENIEFTFLGYTFRPRKAKAKDGTSFTSFLPAICNKAKMHIKRTIKSWRLLYQTNKSLKELSKKYNSVIRGWLTYYGKFGRAEIAKVMEHVNLHLVMWVMRKHKKYKYKRKRASEYLYTIARYTKNLFYHWDVGIKPMTR
ncbi:MAG: group II intron reverse transcriptase/maturase [Clostridia bacterium]